MVVPFFSGPLAEFNPRRSLRARIALILGLCGLGLGLVLGVLVEREARSQLDRQVSASAAQQADLIGHSIASLLRHRLATVKRLAARPEVASDLRDPLMLAPLLDQTREQSPELAWLGLANAEGRLLVATGRIGEDEQVDAQDWFQAARRADFLSEPTSRSWLNERLPMTDGGGPRELLMLATPVIDYEGRAVGVVVAALDWQHVRERHRALNLRAQLGPAMLSQLLASPGQLLLGDGPAPGAGQWQALRELARRGQTGVIDGGPQGPQLAAAAALWPLADGARAASVAGSAAAPQGSASGGDAEPWLLVLHQDLAVATAPQRALRQRLWLIGALAALGFGALSWVLAGHFVRPVRRLADTAERLRRGESVRFDGVSAGADDDLQLLADTLHRLDGSLREQMAAQQAVAVELELHRSRLQDLVDQRTAALRSAIEARTASEAFTRTVADHLPGLVAYWGANERLRFANHAFSHWFRLDRAQALGMPMAAVVGASVWQRLRSQAAAEPGAPISPGDPGDDLLLHDGQGSPHRFWPQRLPDRQDGQSQGQLQGQLQGPDWFAIDVTRVRLTEQRLHELNRELRLSRDRAEAANQAKTAFLANMSHEIRTPLNAILGMGYLIGREPMAADNPQRVQIINDAANHLLGVISDLLDLSKIESGRFSLDESPFDLGELLSRTLGMVRSAARDKGLALTMDDAVTERQWVGDGGRLSQALLNLLGNAVKFTDQGQVSLSVRCVAADEAGGQLRFEVADTGPGIEPSVLDRLFAPFVQADASRTRRHGGTGLGLAITRQIARLMGGDAGASSQEGQGSRFWFTVRLRRPAAVAALPRPPATPALPAERLLRSHCRGARVLLAEDNPVNQLVASELLQVAGLQVVAVTHGAAALAQVLAGGVDLVLMDVHMPGMDGLEATRQIRSHPELRRLPILAMTADVFADERLACLQAGMDDHLAKPVDPQALYRMLLQWLPGVPAEVLADLDMDPGTAEAAGSGRSA